MKFTLDEGAFAPEYAHLTDGGMDLRSPDDYVIPCALAPNEHLHSECPTNSVIIDTGVHVQLPPGTVGFLKSKSGLNVKHGVVSEGVIDEGYTGSIVVKLYNHDPYEDWHIKRGDKITQLVILPCLHFDLNQVDSLEKTERGDNGFGSTGS